MKVKVIDYYEEREKDTLDKVADWACAQLNLEEYPEDKPLLFCDERQAVFNGKVENYLKK